MQGEAAAAIAAATAVDVFALAGVRLGGWIIAIT
jgi:hypothetical protein